MRNSNSIFPDGTLIEIRTPKRPNFNHRCVCREYAELLIGGEHGKCVL